MNSDDFQLPIVYLNPGNLFTSDLKSDKPVRVKTVLGSCVSVTMFNRRMGISAMCHALLPRCMKRSKCVHDIQGFLAVNCSEPFKYVNCVIPDMMARFRRRGISPQDIEVKLFGGADMFELDISRLTQSVGRQNIAAAMEALEAEDLKISGGDVGGLIGRKLFFFTHTGEVWMKRLK